MNRRIFSFKRRIAIALFLASTVSWAFVWTRSEASRGLAESAREQERIVEANRSDVAEEPENSIKIASARTQGTGTLKRYGALKISSGDREEEKGSPRVAIAADFNSDGINDLLVAHNGRLVLHRGNINAFAPQTQAAWEAIRDGRFVSPFERKTRTFSVPAAADFLFAADFNRDARLDAAFAGRGDNVLYVLEGDGAGNFPNLRRIETGGAITSLASGDVNRADGLTDLIVGTHGSDGFSLQLFSGLGDIFAASPIVFNLHAQAEAIVVGQLDENEFADIAIAAGNEILILSGADAPEDGVARQVETQSLSQTAKARSLVVGDFLPDRDNRAELAVLGEDGSVSVLKRGTLDTAPVTRREYLAEQVRELRAKGYPVPDRILRQLTAKDLRQPAPRTVGDTKTWSEADGTFAAAPNFAASPQAILTKGRIGRSATEDLIVLDASANRVLVLPFGAEPGAENQTEFTGERRTVEYAVEDQPVAVLPMRLNHDGETDLLVVGRGHVGAIVSAPQALFTVTSNADLPDTTPGNGTCLASNGQCTLRAAIMEANKLAGNDSITINGGIGTITLNRGQPDDDAGGTNDEASGDLDITCVIDPGSQLCQQPYSSNINDLTITGAAGNSIVQAGTFTAGLGGINTDRVFDIGMDGIFGGHFGGTTGIEVTLTNLTIQNGNVRQGPIVAGGSNYAQGGGIRYDGFGNGFGTLTLSNTTVTNNQCDHEGGGVEQVYGTFSATGSTFSNNIAKAGQGGGVFWGAATSNSNVMITNSTFSGNEVRQGTVFGTFTPDADGGGIRANGGTVNTITINNTNFTNNVAWEDAGAIKTHGGIATVTGGTMTGNTSRRHGGVAYGDRSVETDPVFLTISGSTMRNNTANSDNAGTGLEAGAGGAVFQDRGVLTLTNCTIGGTGALEPNTATDGGGVAHFFTVDSAAGNNANQTTVNINNGSIIGNNATANGTTVGNNGGGIYFNSALFDTNVSVLNIGQTTPVALDSNKAENNGGGIYTSNGATVNLEDMTLRSNQANSDSSGGGDGGAFYQNSGTTTFTGSLTIGGLGFANSAINGGGISNAAGTLTLPSNASITFNTATGNGGGINNGGTTNSFSGAAISNNSATTDGGGIYNTGTITVSGATINNNTAANGSGIHAAGGTFSLAGTDNISGNVNIASGTLTTASGNTTNLTGNFSESSGTFNANNSTINLTGNFSYTGGTFNSNTGTFNFNGAAAQTIAASSAITFNHLSDANVTEPLAISNSINVNGSLTANGAATILNPAAAAVIGGTGTLTGTGTARVTSATGTNDFFTQYAMSNRTLTNLTIDYVGAAAQGVSATTYSDLRINNGSGASLSGNVIVDGTLTLTAGQLAVGTNTLTLNGAFNTPGGTFTSEANGTVNYNQGSNGQVVLSGNYGNLTFSNFNKDLTTAIIGIAGAFTPGTGTATTTGSSITFNGAVAQTIPGFNYNNLTLNNAAGASLSGSIIVAGTLTLTSGNLGVGTNTLTLNGAATATGGTLSSAATGTVNYNLGSNGQVVLSGNYGNLTFSNFNKDLTNANIGIAGTFTPGSGTPTITGSTFVYNGASAQTLPATFPTYNNLTLNNAAGTSGFAGLTVQGLLLIQAGTFTTGSTFNNVQINSGATLAGTNATTMNVTGNWTNDGGAASSFTSNGNTVNFNGSAAQTIGGTTETNFNNLTIANPVSVTMTQNETVNGLLTLTNDLTTGLNVLTMPGGVTPATSGPATNAADVLGNVKRTGFALTTPLSFGNPFNTIAINSGALPTDINVHLVKSSPTGFSGSVDRTYTITANGAHGPATLSLHYRDSELDGNTPETSLNLRRFNGVGWAPIPATQSSTGDLVDNWLQNDNVQTFSPWTFSTFSPTAADGTVTGRIVDAGGAPVEGAVVRLSGTQNRKFITDANGVYRFDKVETGGFYTVTPSRANYTFSPASRSFSQTGQTTEAAFDASATNSGLVNPLDTPEYFVRQNYLDFLGREPDEAGFNFWSDQILGCSGDVGCVDRKRTNVSAAYFLSIEFQQTGGLVDALYRASFGRRPSYLEFKPDAAAVAPLLVVGSANWEQTLENGKTAFLNAFVQRAAFQAAYGSLSNDAYVDTLIANTGVIFSSAERNALVTGLGGGMTRAGVLRAIVENPSVLAAKRNEAFVMMEYFGYLRREPDAVGYDYWLDKLNQFNGNFEQAEMVRAFIISSEYRNRFPR